MRYNTDIFIRWGAYLDHPVFGSLKKGTARCCRYHSWWKRYTKQTKQDRDRSTEVV